MTKQTETNLMIEPLHVASIGGHPFRFFRTPNKDGQPDLPWHAIDDLHRALGLNREQRKFCTSCADVAAFEPW